MSTPRLTFAQRLAGLPLIGSLLSMAPIRGRLAMLVMAALVTFALLAISGLNGPLTNLEERLGTLGWTLAPETDTESRVVIVAIDEQSIDEVGPWPWSRETMAELTRAIDAAGAQLQIHDIVYADAKDGDAQLSAALANARGAVISQVPVLDVNQAPGLAPETIRAGQMMGSLAGIQCVESSGLMSTASFLAPHAGFNAIAKGHIAPVVNGDGSISKQPAVVCVDGQAYPALALSALLEATGSGIDGVNSAKIIPNNSPMGAAQTLTLDSYPGLAVPLDAEGNLRISYRRAPESYLVIPAADILFGRAGTELLNKAWVLVGATAFGLGDVVPTPYSGATPGVELQARILGSLLDVAVPYAPNSAAAIQILIVGLFALALLVMASKMTGRLTTLLLPSAAFLLPLLSLMLHAQMLRSADLWLGWMPSAIYAIIASGLLFVLEQARTRSQRDRVFNNLASYLPSEVAEEIAYSLPTSNVVAERKDFTLLSADLRNFSSFSEARSPEESAAVLHFFFQKAAEIIEAHGGKVHEYKGDSLLALWDTQSADAALNALNAAQKMVAEIDHISLSANTPYGLEPLALGVGIEQGAALIGSIGPAHRRTHTLLGDTVTIALRIQEMTAELAQPILLGERAARQIDAELLQSQGSFLLQGLTIPHVLFAPQPDEKTLTSLTDAFGDFASGDDTQPRLRVLAGGRRS
jgi:CHASE2 domain-containing sensor protein/class 3 adenylate cyclase